MPTATRFLLAACLAAFAALAPAPAAQAQPADCLTEPTLRDVVECIKDHMPDEETEGYQLPTAADLAAFREVVGDMLAGPCSTVVVPSALQPFYTVAPFVEGGRTYCLLVETGDADDDEVVDRGWGTFIVNHDPEAKLLSIDVPHPLNDTDTPEEGIEIFKGVNARTFLMAGAHREANDAESPCDDDYQIADAAHNANHTFHATIEAMDAFDEARGQAFTSIQFHGMGESSCPGVDVYISHGATRAPLPGSLADQLKQNLSNALPAAWGWTVTVPGDAPSCDKSGTKNMQGKLLNGVVPGAVCAARNYNYTGRFIHIEQKRYVRADSVYGYWIDAINALDPTIAPPPPGYWLTSPNGGEVWEKGTTQYITWDAQNITDQVHLAVIKGTSQVKLITKKTPNTGVYAWTIPMNLAADSLYTIRIRSTVDEDIRDYSDAVISIVDPPGAAVKSDAGAATFFLEQNRPNPFNPATTIRYTLPAATDVTLRVYDVAGREVATLIDGPQAAGQHAVRFEAAHLASGIYLYRLEAGGTSETRRMLLLK